MLKFYSCVFSVFILLYISFTSATKVSLDGYGIFEEFKEQCMSEHGITEGQIVNFTKSGNISDEQFSCFLKCLSVKTTLVNEEGKLIIDELMSLMRTIIKPSEIEVFERDLKKCSEMKGDNDCSTASAQVSCLMDALRSTS